MKPSERFRSSKGKSRSKSRGSRYGGLKRSTPRSPQPARGLYRLEILRTRVTTENGRWFFADFRVLDSNTDKTPEGSKTAMLQCVTDGKAFKVGGPKVRAFVMAAMGYDDDDAFDEFDPDGEFIDLVEGEIDSYESPDGEEFGENPLEGRTVLAEVSKGADRDDGDWYREWAFEPDTGKKAKKPAKPSREEDEDDSDDEEDEDERPAKKKTPSKPVKKPARRSRDEEDDEEEEQDEDDSDDEDEDEAPRRKRR